MLHITIIALGKIKESYWKEAIDEYLKRLQAFAKVTIVELKDESFSEKDNLDVVRKKEAEKIKKAIPKGSFVFALDEKGKEYTSQAFSKRLETLRQTNSSLTFVIGGTTGLHASITNTANETFSLSKLTFPHGLARVFLVEQLYRAFMILHGRTYHY